MEKKTIALVLSGGGNRGAIHIGVLHAFDEYNINIDAISGTSAGAIIGALYCSGLSALELKDILDSQTIRKMLNLRFAKDGIADMKSLRKLLETNIQHNSYDKLKKKFFVCASDIYEADYEIFSDGDLISHVCASASVPIIFKPLIINNKHYVDGGLFNNLPVEPVLNKYDTVIGVHVNNYKIGGSLGYKVIAKQVFSVVIKHNVKRNMKLCDFVIDPILEKSYRNFSKKTTNELFEIGYKEGIAFLKQNKFI
jgi:NTE family protein